MHALGALRNPTKHVAAQNREFCTKVIANVFADLGVCRDLPLTARASSKAQYLPQALSPAILGTDYRPTKHDDRRRSARILWILPPAGRCSIEQVAEHMGIDRRPSYRRLQPRALPSPRSSTASSREGGTLSRGSKPTTFTWVAQMLKFSALRAFSRWFQER
jgi:hypothetical protein